MGIIKNYNTLCTSDNRKIVLDLIEEGLKETSPDILIKKMVNINGDVITIQNTKVNLNEYKRIFLVSFGKGSSLISKLIIDLIGEDRLYKGFIIDLIPRHFSDKITFTIGDHPISSKNNFLFTENVLKNTENLAQEDLVIVITCGGGSSLFELPSKINFERKIEIDKALIKSGADIYQLNTIRKHLSKVKGGGFARHIYPARVVNLIFSDVLGNDLSFIASGPTVMDNTTINDAFELIQKFNLDRQFELSIKELTKTSKEEKYFENVSNVLIEDNMVPLSAIKNMAEKNGLNVSILTDRLKGEASTIGRYLIEETKPGTVLLAGGETAVTVKGNGVGGRNQELVLGALPHLSKNTVIASFGTDGWDNSPYDGAIADLSTFNKAQKLNLNPLSYLENNDSYHFFEKIGDGIDTGKLESNVSDIMIVLKK